jgi:hypothetical protein
MATVRGHAKEDVENNNENGKFPRPMRSLPKISAAQGSGQPTAPIRRGIEATRTANGETRTKATEAVTLPRVAHRRGERQR